MVVYCKKKISSSLMTNEYILINVNCPLTLIECCQVHSQYGCKRIFDIINSEQVMVKNDRNIFEIPAL